MAYIASYKTDSGRFYFLWSFEQQATGEIRIYILESPPYGDRKTDGRLTHVNWDDRRPYICYKPQPRCLKDALAIAKGWAERTEAYIVEGRDFSDQRSFSPFPAGRVGPEDFDDQF